MMLMMFLSQKIVQAHEQVENFHYTPYLRLSRTMRIKHPVYSEFSGFCNSLLERKMFITFIYKKRIYYFIEIGLFICHKWLKHCLESKNSTEASGGGNVLTQRQPIFLKDCCHFLDQVQDIKSLTVVTNVLLPLTLFLVQFSCRTEGMGVLTYLVSVFHFVVGLSAATISKAEEDTHKPEDLMCLNCAVV